MANTYEEARAALSAFARTSWLAALVVVSLPSTTPIAYDNLNFDPPEDGSTWARLNIQHITADRASLGSPDTCRFRREGLLSIQIFVPLGDGTLVADQIADSLVEAFEDVGAIENIWFRNIRMKEVGSDGTFHQVNVEVDFTFDRVT